MSDVDYSSPEHRLDNMSNMRFVRAYARVRHHILNPGTHFERVPWMEGYVSELDKELAAELMLPEQTFLSRLTDIGERLCKPKDGQDQAEFPAV